MTVAEMSAITVVQRLRVRLSRFFFEDQIVVGPAELPEVKPLSHAGQAPRVE